MTPWPDGSSAEAPWRLAVSSDRQTIDLHCHWGLSAFGFGGDGSCWTDAVWDGQTTTMDVDVDVPGSWTRQVLREERENIASLVVWRIAFCLYSLSPPARSLLFGEYLHYKSPWTPKASTYTPTSLPQENTHIKIPPASFSSVVTIPKLSPFFFSHPKNLPPNAPALTTLPSANTTSQSAPSTASFLCAIVITVLSLNSSLNSR